MKPRRNPASVVVPNLTRPDARWFAEGIDVRDGDGPYAVQRLANPLFTPSVKREISLARSDRVYAIGSCFARGIEKAMAGRGFRVESAAKEFDGFELSRPGVTGLGFTNKYTPVAILNELSWALDEGAIFPTESLVELDDASCIDPHTNPTLKWVDRERTLERREIIHRVTSRIAESRLVVITLGLVEAWYDSHAGVFLNMTPTRAMQEAYPGRYEFQLLSYDECRGYLDGIGQLFRNQGLRLPEIVVTVSPVPLLATFSGMDVVVANTYSKSVLRACAQDWAMDDENVHYFPSYEIVVNSSRGLAWEEDGRHVRGELVQHIMSVFVGSFVSIADVD